MLKYLMLLVFTLIATSAFAGDVYVRGYYKKDGTYVAPHVRSAPNNTVTDNYSYRGAAPRVLLPAPYRLPSTDFSHRAPVPRTRCADGWVSNSTGSGTCSSHGGVAARDTRRAGGAGYDAYALARPDRQPSLSYAYVGASLVDPNDASYVYRPLENGDYAVFRDGRRTGTAAQGTAAWNSINTVSSRKARITSVEAQTAIQTIRSLRLSEEEKAKRITSIIARYSGVEAQSLTPEDVRQQLLLLNR